MATGRPGLTIFAASKTYTGGITISAGDVANNGVLAFNRSDAVTFGGAISGAGVVQQAGSGATILMGANTYSGRTQVLTGTLQAGAADRFSAASAHQVSSGATLATGGFNQTVAALANAGTVRLAVGDSGTPGTVLSVTGDYVGQGGVVVFNAVLNDDTSATDMLKIAGGSTGSSLVRVNNRSVGRSASAQRVEVRT